MRFAILGSGAVGGYVGACLCRAGHDVTFIARGPHLAALRERGLEIHSPLGDFRVHGAAEEDTARVGVVDAVLVAVKNYDNPTALPLLRPMVGPQTSVLTLQNGVDGIDACAEVVGPPRVLGGVTYVFAALESPGRVVQTGTTRRIVFGEVFDPPRTLSSRVETIGRALADAAIETVMLPDARPALWEKLAYLSPFSGLTAAARLPIGPLWQLPAVRQAFARGVMEVEGVARAEGIELPAGLVEKLSAFVDSLPPSSRSSLLIDLQNGKRLEVEALQGTVVRRGAQAAVPTPMLSTLYAVLRPYADGTLT